MEPGGPKTLDEHIRGYKDILTSLLDTDDKAELKTYLDKFVFLVKRENLDPEEACMDILEAFDNDRAAAKASGETNSQTAEESFRSIGKPALRLVTPGQLP